MRPRRAMPRFARRALRTLWPNQKLRWTREGLWYLVVWVLLLAIGWHQQINLIMLVTGLAFGPILASFLVSWATLRRASAVSLRPGTSLSAASSLALASANLPLSARRRAWATR